MGTLLSSDHDTKLLAEIEYSNFAMILLIDIENRLPWAFLHERLLVPHMNVALFAHCCYKFVYLVHTDVQDLFFELMGAHLPL